MIFFKDYLGRKLDEYVAALPAKVHIVRLEERTGLIRARLKGKLIFSFFLIHILMFYEATWELINSDCWL